MSEFIEVHAVDAAGSGEQFVASIRKSAVITVLNLVGLPDEQRPKMANCVLILAGREDPGYVNEPYAVIMEKLNV